jgi:hypothetical protein
VNTDQPHSASDHELLREAYEGEILRRADVLDRHTARSRTHANHPAAHRSAPTNSTMQGDNR